MTSFVALRNLTVQRVVPVSGGIVRITLGGSELGHFQRDGIDCPPFATVTFDDHVKIFPPTDGDLVLPTQRDGHLDWPHDPPAVPRDYTVRRYDPVAGELDIEVAVGHDGPGARWGASVAVGDAIHVAGPRGTTGHPTDGPAFILVGDDASLPPIARFVESAPSGLEVVVVAVVDANNADYPLPEGSTVIVRGSDDDELDQVMGALTDAVASHPGAFVWVALELTAARRARRVLDGLGVDRTSRYVTHYWRRGPRVTARSKADLAEQLRPMVDLMTPVVLRVAVTVGLLDAVAAGYGTAEAAAAEIGCDRHAVAALLTFLTARGLVEASASPTGTSPTGISPSSSPTHRVTPMGELLLRDEATWFHGFLHLDRASGRMGTALAGLLHAVRTGSSGYEAVHGRSWWTALADEEALGADFDDMLSRWSDQWRPAVVAHPVWGAARTVLDVGGGSGRLAAPVATAHPNVAVTIVELAGAAERTAAAMAQRGLDGRVSVAVGDFFEPLPAGNDVVVLAQVLHDWNDADAVRILRRAGAALTPGGRVLVVERLLAATPSGADDHATMGVLMLALFGARERTEADYVALFDAAGLRLASVEAQGPLAVLEVVPAGSAGVAIPADATGAPTSSQPR